MVRAAIRRRRWVVLGSSTVLAACFAAAACSSPGSTRAVPVSGPSPDAGTTGGDRDPLAALEAGTGVSWIVSVDERLHTPYFAEPVGDPSVTLGSDQKPEAVALAFLTRYGAVFHITDTRERAPERP